MVITSNEREREGRGGAGGHHLVKSNPMASSAIRGRGEEGPTVPMFVMRHHHLAS